MINLNLVKASHFIALLLSLTYSLFLGSMNSAFAETRKFKSTPVLISKTGRVYLFKVVPGAEPKPGNMVLIKEGPKALMAFRVLRADTEKNQYAARKAKKYNQTEELQLNLEYDSIEKSALASTSTPPPEPEPKTIPEPTTLEPTSAEPTTAEPINVEQLDAPSEPVPEPTPENVSEEYFYDDEETSLYEVEEIHALDPYRAAFSLMGSYSRNLSSFQIRGTVQSSILAFLSIKTFKDILFFSKQAQDWIDIEFGVGYYTYLNASTSPNRSFTILPLLAQAKYNIQVSETLSINAYGGFGFNAIISSKNATSFDKKRFGNIQQLMGLGLVYNMGPHWATRVDLGWDRMALGLMLKW